MKCITCQADIPPAWVNAINKNECPGCGGVIMDDSSKELLVQLREAMIKMPNDPEGLAGWLMSTYDLLPKGSIEPTNFHRKPVYNNVVANITPDGTPIKFADTPTNQFAKRAGVDKILNDPKLAAMQQMIHSINSIDGQMYGGAPEPETEEISEEEQEMLEQQHIASLAARAKAQGRKLTMRDALSNSTEFNLGGDARPLSEAETEMVKHLVGGPSGDSEMEELQNLPPALQADRLKRLAAQRELKFGGSAGLIKRSG
jgi:hypothetical protein